MTRGTKVCKECKKRGKPCGAECPLKEHYARVADNEALLNGSNELNRFVSNSIAVEQPQQNEKLDLKISTLVSEQKEAKNWQRPDWRDANSYPEPKKTTIHQWQWEFLRRHPDYEADYANFEALWESDDDWTGTEELRPFYGKYGIKYMPAPWQDYKEEGPSEVRDDLQFLRPFQHQVFEKGKVYASHLYPGVNLFPDKPPPERLLRLEREGEVMIKLHTSTPITQQLEWLKELLTELQKPLVSGGKQLDRRIRADQYPEYLRLLDAKHAGCTNREIAEVLYNNGNRLPYFDRSNEERIVLSRLRRARELSSEEYRYLHLYPNAPRKGSTTNKRTFSKKRDTVSRIR
jgi:hypothetical protein